MSISRLCELAGIPYTPRVLTEGDVINGRFHQRPKVDVSALSNAIENAMNWPDEPLELTDPEKKPGIWLSVFLESTGERIQVLGPFDTIADAQRGLVSFVVQDISIDDYDGDEDEYQDEIERTKEELSADQWTQIPMRVPRQAGQLTSLALCRDEMWALITKDMIPYCENVFVVEPTRAFTPSSAVLDLQHEIAQVRYDIRNASGSDVTILRKREQELMKRLQAMKIPT